MPIGRAQAMRRTTTKTRAALVGVALLATATVLATSAVAAPAPSYHTIYRKGRIVPIGASIPHADGAMVDSRIVANLRYLARTYPLYVQEGYAGPLAGVGKVGCPKCHVKHSDHYNGAAVDIVPLSWDGLGCDRSWKAITRLAHWAEPRQNRPRLPFRWVGYNRDYNHGCGNHLHLSWDHAFAKRYRLADWLTVFDVPGKAGEPAPPPEPVEPPPVTTPPDVPVTGREAPGA
jgi:hypothetical protein